MSSTKRSRSTSKNTSKSNKKSRKTKSSTTTTTSSTSWFDPNNLKVLTLRQPWASSIMYGGKTIENRSWKSEPLMQHGSSGWFAVHAGATYESPTKYYTKQNMQDLWPYLDGSTKKDFPLSQILGLAHVSEFKSYESAKNMPWALDSKGKRGSHCWIIDRVIPVKHGTEQLFGSKGALGLWKCPLPMAKILHTFNDEEEPVLSDGGGGSSGGGGGGSSSSSSEGFAGISSSTEKVICNL